MNKDENGYKSNEIYSYKTYNTIGYISGILIPLLGVIMGIVGVTQRKKNAWSIIIISILSWVVNAYLFRLLN